MDFETWKKKLEEEGIEYRNEPAGPYLIFYTQKSVSGDSDFNKLFEVIGKNPQVANVNMEKSGEDYDITIEMQPAIQAIMEVNPSKNPNVNALLAIAEKEVAKSYDSRPANERLDQTRKLIKDLEAINWGRR